MTHGSLRFLILLTAGLCSCGRPDAQKSAAAPPAPVEVAVAEKRTMPVQMKSIGAVEPIASVQIKSKVQGEILKVHFADGASVKAGDLLFSIDPRAFEAALKRAQANLAMSQATADNASEQAERYATLIKRGAASKEQTAQFLATAISQKSELAARQADVDEAQLSLDWTQVRAPISGRAGAALLKAGNIVQANGESLAIINQMQPIYVAFALPENSLDELRQWLDHGPPVVTAYAPDTGRLLDTGELSFIDNAVDRGSGMIAFKATFPNAEEKLWPGLFVDVTVKLTEEPDVTVIPAVAIMEGQQGSQVFVVEGDTAILRKIEVERTVDGLAIIAGGLQPGETVITTGQLRVSADGKVIVKNSEASPPAP
ncbi:MAG: efflux RND transporter periplasmic adaptor subunit [Chthoniobacterales bacterium]|nr:efflux RND transporter periplasmic adaptor subunit [Chthoniobacterales bacterium]